jgi:hypothetical protein
MSDSPYYVEHEIEPLFVLTAQTRVVREVAGVPGGDWTIFDVVSGKFAGPRLHGRLVPTGGDWPTRTAGGSRLDVRLLLETHDGISLLFRYGGRATQADGNVRIEVAGTFDAPAGPYEWLNNVQTFGFGVPLAEGVRYHFYRFK